MIGRVRNSLFRVQSGRSKKESTEVERSYRSKVDGLRAGRSFQNKPDVPKGENCTVHYNASGRPSNDSGTLKLSELDKASIGNVKHGLDI